MNAIKKNILELFFAFALGATLSAQTNTFPSTGSVGIGTTTPYSTLDITNGTTHTYIVPRSTAAGTGLEPGTDLASYGHTLNLAGDIAGGGSAGGVNIAFYNSSWGWGRALSVKNSTSWTSGKLLLMPDGGNVGIGTTNPTQKLSVNGTIQAKEVIVQTGWSDYVFNRDYRLAPLSEVERRIKADKHLPGIPSAQEVADHGVSVGEMQSKLLAKVEELTLHLIAQEKRIAKLERENAALQSR